MPAGQDHRTDGTAQTAPHRRAAAPSLQSPLPMAAEPLQRQGAFGLHELAIEVAYRAHQRPKLEAFSNALFIVLKTAQLEADKAVQGETNLFVVPNFMVSVRHGAPSSYAQGLAPSGAGMKGLHEGPGFALYVVIDVVADHCQPIVAEFEQDFEAIETDIFGDPFGRLVIKRLYHLKRLMLGDLRDCVLRLVGQIDGKRDMRITAMQETWPWWRTTRTRSSSGSSACTG